MQRDSDLLRDYADHGSQAAFRELVDRHLPLVYRAAFRQVGLDAHRAQDVAQLVFVALARQARLLAGHPSLCAWLYSTTHRIVCQTLRTEMRRRKREEAWVREISEPADKDASFWSVLAPVLDESIRALPEGERDAIVLRFFDRRSFAEVGDALRIGEDAARMRVNRALEKLRRRLAPVGASVSPATLANLLAADASLGVPAGLAGTIAAGAAHVVPVSGVAIMAGFMATTKLITGAVAVAAALVVGVATRQWSAVRALEAELHAAQEEAGSLQARLGVRKPSSGFTSSAPVESSPASVAVVDPWAEIRAKGDAFLAAHPDIRELLVHSQRARIRGKYLPLYRELSLTEDRIAALEALLLGSSGKAWREFPLFVGEHFTPQERDRRLRDLLGEDGFARYSAARAGGGGEDVAQQLAAQLAYTDAPLAGEEAIVVRDIIDEARASAGSEGDYWELAWPRLRKALSPAQLDGLLSIRAQFRYRATQAADGRRVQ